MVPAELDRAFTRELGNVIFRDEDKVEIICSAGTYSVKHLLFDVTVEASVVQAEVSQKPATPTPPALSGAQLTLKLLDADLVPDAKIELDVAGTTVSFKNLGLRLEHFWKLQPAKGTVHELSLAEVAMIRVFTGPAHKPINNWLRQNMESAASFQDLLPRRNSSSLEENSLKQSPYREDSVNSSCSTRRRGANGAQMARQISCFVPTNSEEGKKNAWSTSTAVLAQALTKLSLFATEQYEAAEDERKLDEQSESTDVTPNRGQAGWRRRSQSSELLIKQPDPTQGASEAAVGAAKRVVFRGVDRSLPRWIDDSSLEHQIFSERGVLSAGLVVFEKRSSLLRPARPPPHTDRRPSARRHRFRPAARAAFRGRAREGRPRLPI